MNKYVCEIFGTFKCTKYVYAENEEKARDLAGDDINIDDYDIEEIFVKKIQK